MHGPEYGGETELLPFVVNLERGYAGNEPAVGLAFCEGFNGCRFLEPKVETGKQTSNSPLEHIRITFTGIVRRHEAEIERNTRVGANSCGENGPSCTVGGRQNASVTLLDESLNIVYVVG